MIVRTYGRRNRGVARSYSDPSFNDDVSDGGFGDSSSQDSPQDVYNFTFSSQDSSAHWSFSSDPYDPFRYDSLQDSRELAILPPRKPLVADDLGGGDGVILKSKKPRNLKRKENGAAAKKMKSKEWRSDYVGPTTPPLAAMTTLMETQEFGEMMEHVDEVNFALDGLRKAQPVRIRRASLLTLLSICVTAQQRRLLRTHGMAKIIVDTILGLSFDDSPSNLAAATLFYVLTCDGQDDQLLDSPSCICFLIKLLKPHSPDATKNKAPIFGTKLLSLRKDADTFQDASKGMDSASAAILHKVQEILVNRKEMKPINEMEKLKLNAKWIAMLTMEKSCLSTISIEDTSGTVRKTGGNFKEKLREVGGLDAVFEVARICHSTMEGWLEQSSYLILESKDKLGLESLVLLLKCLKIMENATFQSRDNQIHLLEMKGNLTRDCFPKTFTKLILCVIRILSDVSLQKRSSFGCSGNEKFCSTSNRSGHTSSLPLLAADKVDTDDVSLDALINGSIMGSISSQMSFDAIQSSQYSSAVRSGFSKSDFKTPGVSLSDTLLLKMRVDSSRCGSCSGTSNGSDNGFLTNKQGSRMKLSSGNRPKYYEDNKLELLEDSLDPFTFDEDEFEPSKWDLLSGRQKVSAQKGRTATKEPEGRCQSLIILSQQDSSSNEIHHSPESSCSSVDDEEKTNLLADCLLTAVKVLMNLTNDNPEGCRQIASCGGLETLSSLIAAHFPSFLSYFPTFRVLKENNFPSTSSVETDDHKDTCLTDQELDFLVAILGLLVNLVEKDGNNRSRLAAANVSFPDSKGLIKDNQKHVIPLLCSIFLANQGAGEAAGEGKLFDLDDEDALLQGEKEAEMMIVEAYAALLLAFLSTESTIIRSAIAECLPDHNLAILVPVLERFVDFHLTLNMISPETHKVVREVIESCRIR